MSAIPPAREAGGVRQTDGGHEKPASAEAGRVKVCVTVPGKERTHPHTWYARIGSLNSAPERQVGRIETKIRLGRSRAGQGSLREESVVRFYATDPATPVTAAQLWYAKNAEPDRMHGFGRRPGCRQA